MEDEDNLLFKILLVGDSSVGKTSLLRRFADKTFSPIYLPTMFADFQTKTIRLNEKAIYLRLQDTPGQEKNQRTLSSYSRDAHGFMVVYDITNRESFENSRDWLSKCEIRVKNPVKVLIGNKTDMESQRRVTSEEGKELAEQLGMRFIETSAKSHINVENVFKRIAKFMVANSKSENSPEEELIWEIEDENRRSSCCCYF